MLRRFLITWLALSILGYGMVVTADVHNELTTDQVHVIGDHASNSNDLDDSSSCDHCCHGIAHLLGLSNTNTLCLITNRCIISTSYPVSFISFSPPSPFRPPISA